MQHLIRIKENSLLAKIAARKLSAPRMAVTLGNTIYLYNVDKSSFLKNKCWVRHELKHVMQFREHGFFLFLFRYLWESIRKGYRDNKYEIEARAAEQDFAIAELFKIT